MRSYAKDEDTLQFQTVANEITHLIVVDRIFEIFPFRSCMLISWRFKRSIEVISWLESK